MTDRIRRIQGGIRDGLDTHKSDYFAEIWKEVYEIIGQRSLDRRPVIVDPFARNCELGTLTNDLDENTKATWHMDAAEWLHLIAESPFDYGRADLVIFDPPFSGRQAERYEVGHQNIYTDPGYISSCMEAIATILGAGGYMLKFGYNSTRHKTHWDLARMWIVNFGGNRNDVIVTLWKSSPTLEAF